MKKREDMEASNRVRNFLWIGGKAFVYHKGIVGKAIGSSLQYVLFLILSVGI